MHRREATSPTLPETEPRQQWSGPSNLLQSVTLNPPTITIANGRCVSDPLAVAELRAWANCEVSEQ
jgi:hypothetical protein